MTVPNPDVRFTYDDYRSLPEDMSRRYELLDGELLMSPAPTPRHQRVARELTFLLWQYCRQTGAGEILDAPIDVVFGRGDAREVVQPDIVFIRCDRCDIIDSQAIQGAPDLVVEILSPGTEDRDRGYKKTLYGRYGVREYWIVDPDAKQLEVYRPQATGWVCEVRLGAREWLQTPLLPGLQILLAEVFPQS